ncbi:Cellular retinaldehyde-binding protein [Akanthomyces lecanii RCEF 1005]|uniref:Cellular retinaldehyde-binding protein n=1 Tax=Akanthomyces lecanii RCEF 1005 TaxID=1081108 RepID=A0A168GQG0_CORDF|nr:Cellular retinaldehyde-binding protein [Akanthomyces lecanii RCEF 1005]
MAPTRSETVNRNAVLRDLNGHYGSLDEHQQEALHGFRSLVVQRGYADFQTATPLQDIMLLRFLRARRWDAEAAYTQFNDTETWRQVNQINTVYETIDIEAYKQLRNLYPQWTGRRDRLGAPLYVYAPQTLNGQVVAVSEEVTARPDFSLAKKDEETSTGLVCFAALLDNLLRFTQPLATQLPDRKHPEVPVTLSTYIIDFSGISILQFWSLKSHIRTLACLVSAYYPETLGSIFIVGAPSFFGTVFSWINGWLDPVTVSKIRIVGPSEAKSALEEAIDKCNIPQAYGGDLDYAFGKAPVLDPVLKDIVDWDGGYSSFPLAPLVWEPVEGSPDRVACLKVGRQDGQVQRECVCTIPRTWPPVEDRSP